MAEPRILLLDIETVPNLVTSWGLDVPSGYLDPDNIVTERYIACASWKWLGREPVLSASAKGTGPLPDLSVLRKLHGAMTKADAIVAHNGDRFDVPWIMARLAIAKIPPPPPVPVIDTRRIAKRRFFFNSSRLDYLGARLGLGRKTKIEFEIWRKVLAGDRAAMRRMIEYNRQDVRLLEAVYLRLRPYVPAAVNRSHWSADQRTCPSCGKPALESRGIGRNRVSTYARMQCRDCGAWCSKPPNSKVVR